MSGVLCLSVQYHFKIIPQSNGEITGENSVLHSELENRWKYGFLIIHIVLFLKKTNEIKGFEIK